MVVFMSQKHAYSSWNNYPYSTVQFGTRDTLNVQPTHHQMHLKKRQWDDNTEREVISTRVFPISFENSYISFEGVSVLIRGKLTERFYTSRLYLIEKISKTLKLYELINQEKYQRRSDNGLRTQKLAIVSQNLKKTIG